MPMMNVIGNIGFATVAVAGGYMAVRGLISVGLIATFISYSRQFVRPLNDIANTYNTLMSAIAGAERVFEVMDEKEEPADAPGARELVQPRGVVEFRDVSFGYRADVPVLRGVSFDAPAGSVTAIVGRTGAGKTTIVNLLTRFYELTGGSILVDGVDIRDGGQGPTMQSSGSRRATTPCSSSRGQISASVSASSSPSRAPCLQSRRFSSWTRPPAPWTRARSFASSRA